MNRSEEKIILTEMGRSLMTSTMEGEDSFSLFLTKSSEFLGFDWERPCYASMIDKSFSNFNTIDYVLALIENEAVIAFRTPRDVLKSYELFDTVWGRTIMEAYYSGKFSRSDKLEARSWTTCACGNLNDGIPRSPLGVPRDSILSKLGLEFGYMVDSDDVWGAMFILIKIEKRAVEVLKEQTQNDL